MIVSEAYNFIKKEALAQVLWYNLGQYFKKPFLEDTSGGC